MKNIFKNFLINNINFLIVECMIYNLNFCQKMDGENGDTFTIILIIKLFKK